MARTRALETKKTILIVDDSEFVRSYHSYILEQAHFHAITAVDGSDGLEKLYTNPCDLVLTDINMSNMDGYEFIRSGAGRQKVRLPADYHRVYRK
jgi:CheY-like chemotaxis protein